jgi:hypothetical protein
MSFMRDVQLSARARTQKQLARHVRVVQESAHFAEGFIGLLLSFEISRARRNRTAIKRIVPAVERADRHPVAIDRAGHP